MAETGETPVTTAVGRTATLFDSERAKAARAVATANGAKRVSLTKAVKRYCKRHPHDLMAAAGSLVQTAGDPLHRHWPEAIKALAIMLDGLPGQAKGKATGGLRLTFSDLQAMATGATQVSAQVSMPLDVTAIGQAGSDGGEAKGSPEGARGPAGAGGGPATSSGPLNDDRVGASPLAPPAPVESSTPPSAPPSVASGG